MVKNEFFSVYAKDVSKYQLMDKSKELEVGKLAFAGDKQAQEKLVKSNLRFVIKIAGKFQGRGLDLEDLINEGNNGLIYAAGKYNPGKNTKFITYASHWIIYYIQKAIYNTSLGVKIPIGNKEIYSQEIWRMASLDKEIDESDQNGHIMEEMISDGKNLNPESKFLDDETKEEIEYALDSLSEIERQVITERFGLNGEKEKSFRDIAKDVGFTAEGIRQIQKRAMEKMKSYLVKCAA